MAHQTLTNILEAMTLIVAISVHLILTAMEAMAMEAMDLIEALARHLKLQLLECC